MGLPLAIEPNPDDFSCKFCFGKTPPAPHLDDMYKHPCISTCTLSRAVPSDVHPCRDIDVPNRSPTDDNT